jgi:hypothetical protein
MTPNALAVLLVITSDKQQPASTVNATNSEADAPIPISIVVICV